ncbi:hypothetical protein DMENIID0001_039200 [Sergentomyia squamirostris]
MSTPNSDHEHCTFAMSDNITKEKEQELVRKWLLDNARKVESGTRAPHLVPKKKKISVDEYKAKRQRVEEKVAELQQQHTKPQVWKIPKLQHRDHAEQQKDPALLKQKETSVAGPSQHTHAHSVSNKINKLPKASKYTPFLEAAALDTLPPKTASVASSSHPRISPPKPAKLDSTYGALLCQLPLGFQFPPPPKGGKKRGGRLVKIRQLKAILRKLNKKQQKD